MQQNDRQDASGTMTYPHRGSWNRLLFKIPKILWRMGLGRYLSDDARGGSKMLVLTTWGRKSQQARHTMLSYVSAGERVFVCSGWGKRSDWYRNMAANPQVTIQIGSRSMTANARRVTAFEEFQSIVEEMFETGGDSHFEDWLASYGIRVDPQDMLAKRDRLYLIAFDPTEEAGPPAMRADLVWVWGLLAILLAGIWLLIAG